MPSQDAGFPERRALHGHRVERSGRSREVIESAFSGSTSLITIGRSRTILNRNRDAGAREFAALVDRLRIIDQGASLPKGLERSCLWVVDASHARKGAPTLEALIRLQDCLRGLGGGSRDWLSMRAAFAIAHPAEPWFEQSSVARVARRDQFASLEQSATKFFKTFSYMPWKRYDAVTAFVQADNFAPPLYFGHRLPTGSLVPKGELHNAHSKIRDHFIISMSRVLRFSIANSFEMEIAFQLFQSGLLILTFEELLSIDLQKTTKAT